MRAQFGGTTKSNAATQPRALGAVELRGDAKARGAGVEESTCGEHERVKVAALKPSVGGGVAYLECDVNFSRGVSDVAAENNAATQLVSLASEQSALAGDERDACPGEFVKGDDGLARCVGTLGSNQNFECSLKAACAASPCCEQRGNRLKVSWSKAAIRTPRERFDARKPHLWAAGASDQPVKKSERAVMKDLAPGALCAVHSVVEHRFFEHRVGENSLWSGRPEEGGGERDVRSLLVQITDIRCAELKVGCMSKYDFFVTRRVGADITVER